MQTKRKSNNAMPKGKKAKGKNVPKTAPRAESIAVVQKAGPRIPRTTQMGNGTGVMIKRAIEKYGLENFKKEILCECSSSSEMYMKEKELVVLSEETYNLKEGGEGGFDYINSNEEVRIAKNKKAREITNSLNSCATL